MNERSHTKRFRVTAVIKYRVDIGVFEATSQDEALEQAMDTPAWYRASKARGGVYDAEFELLTDEENSRG